MRGRANHCWRVRESGCEGERTLACSNFRDGAEYEPEHRQFRPHVTVARMGTRTPPPARRELAPTPPLTFSAEALTVYRSQLRRAGALYEPLARVELV